MSPPGFSRSACGLLVTLFALSNASCAQPTYGEARSDAGAPAALANDAGWLPAPTRDAAALAQVDAGWLPPGAGTEAGTEAGTDAAPEAATPGTDAGACSDCDVAFAPGRYAVLARFYGSSAAAGGGWFAEESVALVDVQPATGASGLIMNWETCAYRGQLTVPLFPVISYAVQSPQTFPRRTFALVVSGKTFQAMGDPALAGYEVLGASSCPVGSSQTHQDRGWLTGGQCACPSAAIPPTAIDDCRVIDSDADGKPGFTVQFAGGAENFAYTRMRDASQIVNGQLASDGHHTAELIANVDTYQLGCARQPCSRGSTQVCPMRQNPVRFLPLVAKQDGTDWTCTEAVAAVDASGLIGLGPPTQPDC